MCCAAYPARTFATITQVDTPRAGVFSARITTAARHAFRHGGVMVMALIDGLMVFLSLPLPHVPIKGKG
jgi:hypothetical protein